MIQNGAIFNEPGLAELTMIFNVIETAAGMANLVQSHVLGINFVFRSYHREHISDRCVTSNIQGDVRHTEVPCWNQDKDVYTMLKRRRTCILDTNKADKGRIHTLAVLAESSENEDEDDMVVGQRVARDGRRPYRVLCKGQSFKTIQDAQAKPCAAIANSND